MHARFSAAWLNFFILFDAEFRITLFQWAQVLQVPESHRKGVTCITGFMLSKNEALVASTSSDGTINVWYLVFSSAKEG